jgi:hypothetical protein
MAVPTSISDCNATAANNSPAGSDSIGTSLDDYLRAHAAIIRQVYDALVVVDGTLLPKAGGSVTGTITTTHQIKGIPPVANEDLARKDYVDNAVSVVNTSSGTYTPTLTNNSNCAVLTVPNVWQYMKVGNVVTVSGFVTCTCTSATNTTFFITLPVASAITNTQQGCGVAFVNVTSGRTVGGINTEASGDRANCFFVALVSGQQEVNCHFTYQVI